MPKPTHRADALALALTLLALAAFLLWLSR